MMRTSRVVCAAISFLCFVSCAVPGAYRQRSLERLFAVAASPYPEERDAATESQRKLSALGTSAVPFLVERLAADDVSEQIASMRILTKIGEGAVPDLTQALADQDLAVAAKAAQTLGQIGDPTASGPLLHALQRGDRRLRSASATALGRMEREEAVGALTAALSDPDKYVRKSAAYALGTIRSAEAVPALIAVLSDSFYGARFAAADALTAIGGPALPAVVSLLSAEEPSLRCLALQVLGRAENPETLPDIVPLLKDEDWAVRGYAVEALAGIGVNAYRPFLEERLRVERHPFARMKLEEALNSW